MYARTYTAIIVHMLGAKLRAKGEGGLYIYYMYTNLHACEIFTGWGGTGEKRRG